MDTAACQADEYCTTPGPWICRRAEMTSTGIQRGAETASAKKPAARGAKEAGTPPEASQSLLQA